MGPGYRIWRTRNEKYMKNKLYSPMDGLLVRLVVEAPVPGVLLTRYLTRAGDPSAGWTSCDDHGTSHPSAGSRLDEVLLRFLLQPAEPICALCTPAHYWIHVLSAGCSFRRPPPCQTSHPGLCSTPACLEDNDLGLTTTTKPLPPSAGSTICPLLVSIFCIRPMPF